MIQDPRNLNPRENEDLEEEEFGSDDPRNPQQNQDWVEPGLGRPVSQNEPLAGDDLTDLEETEAELGEDEENLGSGEEHERIPDRTHERGYR